jgi:hypothetical protein
MGNQEEDGEEGEDSGKKGRFWMEGEDEQPKRRRLRTTEASRQQEHDSADPPTG